MSNFNDLTLTVCVLVCFGIAIVSVNAEFDTKKSSNSTVSESMSWSCANNASCLYSIANSVLTSYKKGEVLKFGIFDLKKLPPPKTPTSVGRSSGFISFLSGNAIRVPVGPMVFSVQRAVDDEDYIEIALLKKSHGQDRGRGGNMGQRKSQKEKKQLQMFIPMYLAATTFGWTMLAVKAVGLLTLKALAISKLALIVAAMVIIKKLMDNASEKLMYPHFPEPQPFIMPYNMDYGLHALQAPEIAAGEMYPLHLAAAAAAAANGGHPHQGLENIAAESNLHQVVDVQNGTQILAGLAKHVGQNHKIKRDDTWMGAARPFLYNYLPTRPMYNVRQ